MGKCSKAISLASEYMNSSKGIQESLKEFSCTIQFYLQGEEPFALKLQDGKAKFLKYEIKDADVQIYADSDTFFDIIIGKINPDQAYLYGTVEIKGSIMYAVVLKHVGEVMRKEHPKLFATVKAFSRFI